MKKEVIVALAALVMSASTPVLAQGGYAGLGIGQSTVQDVDTIDFGPGVSTSVDDTDTSFKVFGGYRFNKNFAAEAAYERLGKVSVRYDDGVDWVKMEAEATAITFTALGFMPINEALSVFGRFGFAMADVDVDASNSLGDSASTSGSSTSPVFGVGIQYDLPTVLIRAEFTRYTDVGDNDTGESDVDVVGVSAGIKF